MKPRRRLTREARYRQLIDTAWQLIRDEGTDALTLGRLAERSAIAKPVVYDHFPTRMALLAALYREFDADQNARMDAALAAGEPSLAARADVIATAYLQCVLTQGREIPGIIAALAGAPELEKIKREYEAAFMAKCRAMLAPFAAGELPAAGLWAMLGAAEALSRAAAHGELDATVAQRELAATIASMVSRTTARA